jgi:septal ring factor EnvC (AmiA/AmiB activator)
LQNKKNKLNDDIKQLNSQLKQTKANKKSQINTIVVINTKLKVREELIGTINQELFQINEAIRQNVEEINQLVNNLTKLKAEYAKMIYFAQRNQDSYTKIMFLFSSGNFNQAYMRIKYFQQYATFRKKQAEEIVSTQRVITGKLTELENQRHSKNVLLGNEVEQKQQLSGEKQQQEIVLSELQQQEKELKKELEKKKVDAQNLQIAIKKLIEAEIKRKLEESIKIAKEKAEKADKIAKTEKGKNDNIDKPIKTTINTKTVSVKTYAPELTAEAEALGADFSSNRGKLPWPVSQARSVFGGEVTSIAVSPTGGKLIIIRHGEYLSVYMNIGEVFVKQGQKVTIKQVIGTIQDEDGKTSMNLQIWKGQKTMDPKGWLFNGN